MVKDERIENFVEALKKRFGEDLKKIILFGSRARGDSVEGSDYDFLLIFNEVTPEIRSNIRDLIGEILYEYSIVFSAFPLTEAILNRKRYSPFIMNVRKEGVLL